MNPNNVIGPRTAVAVTAELSPPNSILGSLARFMSAASDGFSAVSSLVTPAAAEQAVANDIAPPDTGD